MNRIIYFILFTLIHVNKVSSQDLKTLFADACAKNREFKSAAQLWPDTLTCKTTVLKSAQSNIDLCDTFTGDPFTGIASIAIANRLISSTNDLEVQFNNCGASAPSTTTTLSIASTTTFLTSTTSSLSTTTISSDIRSTLMSNITNALSTLVTMFNNTQNSSVEACCLNPIVSDIDLLVDLAFTIKENIFVQSYSVSYNFILGLNLNIEQLQFNWTQCNLNSNENCCNVATTPLITTPTTTDSTTTTPSTSTTTPTTTSTTPSTTTTTPSTTTTTPSTTTTTPTTTSTTTTPTTTSTTPSTTTTTPSTTTTTPSTTTTIPTTTSTTTTPTTTSTTTTPTTTSTTPSTTTTTPSTTTTTPSTTTTTPTTTTTTPSTTTTTPTTTSTTTTISTTTTMKPANTSICLTTSSYKTGRCCLVSGSFTYAAAKAKCNNNGMYLIPIITPSDLTTFSSNVIGSILMSLMSATNNKFWVSGELVGSTWTSVTSVSAQITASINVGTGSCLQSKSSLLQISPGSYQLYQLDCETTLSAMCFY